MTRPCTSSRPSATSSAPADVPRDPAAREHGQHGRVHVAGASTPAAETGGDWWTYRKLSGGRRPGRGRRRHRPRRVFAMIGCAAHGAVEALSLVGEERMTPRSVLDAINAAIRIPAPTAPR
jgi:hypothetical protein